MNAIITMLIICFVPGHSGLLEEAWRIEKQVTVEHCLTMSKVAAGGMV